MKKIFCILLFFYSINLFAQTLVTPNKKINEAFQLAISTIDNNTRNGILAAGADYGGEWTRDIAINSWNCVSLLRPDVAKKSLWSVTINRDTIGHQYWDKIIWVIGALNYFKVNEDTAFLKQAYICSKNTIEQLEKTTFDKSYKLFAGPSVFNDGIAGYPTPIYDSLNSSSSVLAHPNSKSIKCLSTNCIYYSAYMSIYEMSKILNINEEQSKIYLTKALVLKNNIRKYFYNSTEKKLNYLIDNNGRIDASQEGLGISFAIIFGIVDKNEARQIIRNVHISPFGITSIYPDFPRYSPQKPGRHNNIVWPMVNGFWAKACKQINALELFNFELKNLTSLAMDEDKGNNNFKEIYNPYSGKPDGGWQSGKQWKSCNHQTWSTTAYISMILNGLFGLDFENDEIYFKPFLPENLNHIEIKDLPYRSSKLNILLEGSGTSIKLFEVNGKKFRKHSIQPVGGKTYNIRINLVEKF
jgi:glycogen debranching enzyme